MQQSHASELGAIVSQVDAAQSSGGADIAQIQPIAEGKSRGKTPKKGVLAGLLRLLPAECCASPTSRAGRASASHATRAVMEFALPGRSGEVSATCDTTKD